MGGVPLRATERPLGGVGAGGAGAAQDARKLGSAGLDPEFATTKARGQTPADNHQSNPVIHLMHATIPSARMPKSIHLKLMWRKSAMQSHGYSRPGGLVTF